MDLTSKSTIKELLSEHSAKPLKRLGQNFLVSKVVLEKIIETADLKPNDVVLEIGPGIGTITWQLANTVKRVIAVEKDINMVEILGSSVSGPKNIEIVKNNALKIDFGQLNLKKGQYKVVANLPYYITAPVIRMFLETDTPPSQMVLVVQKEVAQRIAARPPKMSILAASVQFYAKPKIISHISKNSFFPKPKVDGTIIKITPDLSSNRDDLLKLTPLFFKIVKVGFSQPRKQLTNNLSKGLKIDKGTVENWLLKNNIQPNQRAETLNIEDWVKLTNTFIVCNN